MSVLAFAALPADAAVSVDSTSFTYSQTFDTLITTGTSQAWSNDSTLAGWSLFTKDSNAITTYNAGAGTSNTGAFYSFGTGTGTDRALGGAASGGAYFGSPSAGAVAGYIALGLTNDSGSQLDSITIGFSGEQWRDGGNVSGALQTMVLEYGFGSSFAAVTSWTAPGGNFNWTSPIANTSATGAAVDGNVAGSVPGKGGTLSSLSWDTSSTLWLRWIERNDTGNDHGLAIDDFSITGVTAAAIPEPASVVLGSLGLLCILRRRR